MSKTTKKLSVRLLSGVIITGAICTPVITHVLANNIKTETKQNNTLIHTENKKSSTKTGIVNTTSLNVHSGASTSHSKIGTFSKGTKVTIVDTSSKGWYKIKYDNGYGYVSNNYITLTTHSVPSSTERTDLNNFLFIGDSFTFLIKDTIQDKNDNVYIFAKSGSKPSYWLDRLASMPSSSSISGVVLLTGVNGASSDSNKTDVKSLISKISAKYPTKQIYVQRIFPVARTFPGANPVEFNKSISSLNSVIKSHVNTLPNVTFIDTTSGFIDKNGYLLHDPGDGLHIDQSYNSMYYNNILNAIKATEK